MIVVSTFQCSLSIIIYLVSIYNITYLFQTFQLRSATNNRIHNSKSLKRSPTLLRCKKRYVSSRAGGAQGSVSGGNNSSLERRTKCNCIHGRRFNLFVSHHIAPAARRNNCSTTFRTNATVVYRLNWMSRTYSNSRRSWYFLFLDSNMANHLLYRYNRLNYANFKQKVVLTHSN